MMNKSAFRAKRRPPALLRKGGPFRLLAALIAMGVLSACGGGGGGVSTPSPSATVKITGSVSALAKAKLSVDAVAVGRAVSAVDWAGAAVQAVDSAGTVIGAGTVNADGTYAVSVSPGNNYFIRVQTGNLVLKAFLPSVATNTSVDVTPTTTAYVMVLAQVLGVANAGEQGASVASALSSVNVSAVMTQIAADPDAAAVASTLAEDIANNYDAASGTASIGAADDSVAAIVASISLTVSTAGIPAAPSSPTGIGVTAGDGQAGITWNPVSGAVSYNIYYRAAANVTIANGTKVSNATSGGAVTGLANGTAYYFVVTAVNAGGESAVSSEVSVTPQVPAPGVPTGISATGGNGQAAVSWAAVSGASSYNIYYRTAANVSIANGTKVSNATSGGAVTGLANGTAYYFVVTAVNAGGESAVSSEVSVTPQVPAPGVPTGISATGGNGQAAVSWMAVSGASSYNVYYSTASGVTASNGTKVAGATSGGTVTGLANGTAYYFVVTAVNAGGESAVSSQVSATPQVPAPGVPTGISVTAGDAQAAVSWTAVSGASSYNVYYSTSSGVTASNGTKVAGATSGGAVTGLANGTAYYFVVTAVNAGGESAVSSQVSATPQVPAPGVPTGISVIAGDAQAAVSWAAVSGASSYNVYYSTASGVTASNGTKVAGATSGGAITGLTNGVIHYFVVTAVNAGGESNISSQVFARPIPGGTWTTKTSMVNQRDNAANVVLNGMVYVLAGAPAGTGILDSMEAYDPSTDSWAAKAAMPAWSSVPIYCPWTGTPGIPAYRYGPAAAAVNGFIYLIGGTRLVNGGGPIYPIAVYDPVGDSWSSTVPATAATTSAGTAGQTLAPFPTGRWGFDVAVVDGLVYAIGGSVQVNGGVTTANGTKVAGAASGAAITGLTNGTNYSFIVTSVDGSGNESAASNEVSATPETAYAAGSIPADLSTVAGDGQVTVNWTGVAGAVSYNVYYDTKPGVTTSSTAKVTGIADPTVTSTISGLTNGTKYYFIVTAVDGAAAETAASDEVSTMPQAAPGGTVPAVSAITGGDGQVTLTWADTGAASYNVYYTTSTNIYYGNVEVYDPVANTWTEKTPMPTPRWGSTVSTVNGLIYAIGGWGGWPELSLVEIYDPGTDTWSTTVPSNPATSALGTAGAALAPMPTARDDFGFSVLNGTIYAIGGDINTFDNAARIPCCSTVVEAYDTVTNTWAAKTAMPTQRDDFDASVVDGVIYAIAGSRDGIFSGATTVSPDPALDAAWMAANNGGFSLTTVEAFTISDIPVPGGVAATAGANQAMLSWNAAAGATSYNIYWSNKAGVSTTANSTRKTGVTSPYTHTGLTAGTWYYYVVTAVTASGESLPSNEVAVKP